jgi:NAD(P)-dependent dehydrogenase (short-subunit alcohol dehydrogenase family)
MAASLRLDGRCALVTGAAPGLGKGRHAAPAAVAAIAVGDGRDPTRCGHRPPVKRTLATLLSG